MKIFNLFIAFLFIVPSILGQDNASPSIEKVDLLEDDSVKVYA